MGRGNSPGGGRGLPVASAPPAGRRAHCASSTPSRKVPAPGVQGPRGVWPGGGLGPFPVLQAQTARPRRAARQLPRPRLRPCVQPVGPRVATWRFARTAAGTAARSVLLRRAPDPAAPPWGGSPRGFGWRRTLKPPLLPPGTRGPGTSPCAPDGHPRALRLVQPLCSLPGRCRLFPRKGPRGPARPWRAARSSSWESPVCPPVWSSPVTAA